MKYSKGKHHNTGFNSKNKTKLDGEENMYFIDKERKRKQIKQEQEKKKERKKRKKNC